MFWFITIYCNAIGTGFRCREICGWPTCAAVSQTPSPVIRANALLAAANRASRPFSSVQIKARINLGSTADRVQTISLFFPDRPAGSSVNSADFNREPKTRALARRMTSSFHGARRRRPHVPLIQHASASRNMDTHTLPCHRLHPPGNRLTTPSASQTST